MIDPNLDHVGIVVPELEPAMDALSTHLGIEWMGVFEPTLPMRDADRGTRDVSLRIGLGPAQPPPHYRRGRDPTPVYFACRIAPSSKHCPQFSGDFTAATSIAAEPRYAHTDAKPGVHQAAHTFAARGGDDGLGITRAD